MQKAPTATLSAGPVAPTIVGPDRDMKDVYILSGLVGFLAIVVAAFWYYSQVDEAAHSNRSSEALDTAQVSQVLKESTDKVTGSAVMPVTHVETVPLASRSTDILHDDIQFEVGRKGLTDDGKAALQRHAEFLQPCPVEDAGSGIGGNHVCICRRQPSAIDAIQGFVCRERDDLGGALFQGARQRT